MCSVCVAKGAELLRYSFPPPHPFNSERATRFWERLETMHTTASYLEPEPADEETIALFHDKGLIEFVRKASTLGYGSLDEGDTPAFKGVLEAAEFAVGSTVACLDRVLSGKSDHGFNPVGGLHHARPDRCAGFCVFNDIGVAIEILRREGLKRILYVDIDVHHGDGVYYPYEFSSDVFIFDVHEDGRYLYPGTGAAYEVGGGPAEGTKVNVPLLPGDGDEKIRELLPQLEEFARMARPEFVILQCGADGLAGDPIGGLKYSAYTHSSVARVLHKVCHEFSDGRMIALGGGGYDPDNCASAWGSVVKEMSENPENVK
jgi:acetoin utilization protein AcuC